MFRSSWGFQLSTPTKIAKASDKVRKGAGEKVVPESPEEAVKYIVGKLAEKHVI